MNQLKQINKEMRLKKKSGIGLFSLLERQLMEWNGINGAEREKQTNGAQPKEPKAPRQALQFFHSFDGWRSEANQKKWKSWFVFLFLSFLINSIHSILCGRASQQRIGIEFHFLLFFLLVMGVAPLAAAELHSIKSFNLIPFHLPRSSLIDWKKKKRD